MTHTVSGWIPLILLGVLAPAGLAEVILPDPPVSNGNFGRVISLRGSTALLGTFEQDESIVREYNAYLARPVDGLGGPLYPVAKLQPDPTSTQYTWGYDLAFSGSIGLVSGEYRDAGSIHVYADVFHGLDSAQGIIRPTARLVTGSVGSPGGNLAMDGSNALFGLSNGVRMDGTKAGLAKLYRNLDTASGEITSADAQLEASDGQEWDRFGTAASLSGSSALIGAPRASTGEAETQVAYLFTGMDTAAGIVNETARLRASDGGQLDYFGKRVRLDGSRGLVTAHQRNAGVGYYFTGLTSASSGTIYETAKLTTQHSSGLALNAAVLHGQNAIFGGTNAAFVFLNLDSASGTVEEDIVLTLTDEGRSSRFGHTVSLEGNRFLIGDTFQTVNTTERAGSVYSGMIDTFSTLDVGLSLRATDGLSFRSRRDWTVGKTTSSNQVILSPGDIAEMVAGAHVYVGRTDSALQNRLVVHGTVIADSLHVGTRGNAQNQLIVGAGGNISQVGEIWLPASNELIVADRQLTTRADQDSFLGSTGLLLWSGSSWYEFQDLPIIYQLTASWDGQYTTFKGTVEYHNTLRSAQMEAPESSGTLRYWGRSVHAGNNTAVVSSCSELASSTVFVYHNISDLEGRAEAPIELGKGQEITPEDDFGHSVATFNAGRGAMVGIPGDEYKPGGSVFVYNLDDEIDGLVSRSAILSTNLSNRYDKFGLAVSASGINGLVGAPGDDHSSSEDAGAAYFFYDIINPLTLNVTESAKLVASDAAPGDAFGQTLSLSRQTALIGAPNHYRASIGNTGAAYVFRGLDETASGTRTETLRLTGSDLADGDGFGQAVSLFESTGIGVGLVGAPSKSRGGMDNAGAVYYYNGVDVATGPMSESARLVASDPASGDQFGQALSIWEFSALVGSPGDDHGTHQGSVYFYDRLTQASGDVTERLKLFGSNGEIGGGFGQAVSLEGTRFLVGAPDASSILHDPAPSGLAYTGDIRTFTTLDIGQTFTKTDGLSFISQDDWIIGEHSSGNWVTLSQGDTADVTAEGLLVSIGLEPDAMENRLIVEGTLRATIISIGSINPDGVQYGRDNELYVSLTGDISSVGMVAVGHGSYLTIEGVDLSAREDLLDYLGTTQLLFYEEEMESMVPLSSGQADCIYEAYWNGSETRIGYVGMVPEPTTLGLLGLGGLALLQRRRSRQA